MITRWAGFVAVTLLAGCASRPYTAKKTEVAAKIESIRSAVKLANAAPAQRTYQPATLAPPPFVGGHRAGPQINATVLPVEVAAKLGTDQQPKRQGFFDTDDSWCIAEAASVVETGKFLEDTEGHTSANSQACADFVLRLRYLLVLKTRAYQADKVESYFIGSVTVVDLDAQKIVGAFDLETRDKGAEIDLE